MRRSLVADASVDRPRAAIGARCFARTNRASKREERMPPAKRRTPYDALFKLLMQHPLVVLHLIRGFLRPRLNFPLPEAQLHEMDKEWITSDMKRRISDKVWLLRDPAGQPRIALLLEGQSRYHARMTRRMAVYLHELGETLDRQALCQANGAPLEMMPLVFHVGPHPWATPWYVYAHSAQMHGAVGFRAGTTIDIHAFAQRELPAANLVSCIIAWELDCLRREGRLRQVGQATRRIIQAELRPLLAESPAALRADFARYLATRVQGAVQGLALRPEAFDSLAALEADMVTLDEIKEDARQFGTQQGLEQGLEQGRLQGLEQGRLQEKEDSLVELVGLFWGEAAGQAFRQQLTRRQASRWPSIRDLHAARQAGRDPFSLLDALA